MDGDNLGGEFLVDRGLGRRGASAALPLEAVAVLRQVFPGLRGGELDRSDERRAGAVDVNHRLDEAVLLVAGDRLLRVEAADHPALREELTDDRIVGGELGGLLRQSLGLGVSALVDHRVVLVDDHRQTLVDLDLLGPLTVDLRLDLGVLLVEGDLGGTLAGRLLDLSSSPVDALRELGAGLGGDVGGGDIGGGNVEKIESLGGGPLGGPTGLELAGGDLGREPGDDQVARQGRLTGGGSSLDGCRGGALRRRTAEGLLNGAAGVGRVAGCRVVGGGIGDGDGNRECLDGVVGDEDSGDGEHRQGDPRQPDPAGGRGLVTNRLQARRWPSVAGCSVDVAEACHEHDPRGWENREGGIVTGPGGNGSRASLAAERDVFGPREIVFASRPGENRRRAPRRRDRSPLSWRGRGGRKSTATDYPAPVLGRSRARSSVSRSWSTRNGLKRTRLMPAWRALTIEWPGS